jgi:hypothetical protein
MGAERFWNWYVYDGYVWKRFDIKDLEGAFLHACSWLYGGKLEDCWRFKDPLLGREVEIHLELCTMGRVYRNEMELDFSLENSEVIRWDHSGACPSGSHLGAKSEIKIPKYIKDQIRHVRRKYDGGE